jgi:hypothetical protein
MGGRDAPEYAGIMEMFENYYIAMRRCAVDGSLWADTTTMGATLDECRKKAGKADRIIPSYRSSNPVVAIYACHIEWRKN